MVPASYNFTVVRGSSGPTQGLKVRLKAKETDGSLSNIVFDDVRLSISSKGVLLLRATIGNAKLIVTDPTQAEVAWVPTAADTRLIPLGQKSFYELEVRNGIYETVYMIGEIIGVGGLNDDVGDA